MRFAKLKKRGGKKRKTSKSIEGGGTAAVPGRLSHRAKEKKNLLKGVEGTMVCGKTFAKRSLDL